MNHVEEGQHGISVFALRNPKEKKGAESNVCVDGHTGHADKAPPFHT